MSNTPILIALATAALVTTACGPGDVEQFNQPANITSVGPISFDGTSLLVDYTLFDREGDDVNIDVGVCPEDAQGPGTDCPTPVSGADGDGRKRLPTAPDGTDILHRLAWNVGCGAVDGDQCVATQLDQSYVIHISVQGSDKTVTTEPFTLGEDFSVSELPACDKSAGTIPDPCPPNDQ